MASREFAEIEIIADDRRAHGRRRRHHRREELLRRDRQRRRRARAPVPRARARRSGSPSRPTAGCQPDGALGGASRSSRTWSRAYTSVRDGARLRDRASATATTRCSPTSRAGRRQRRRAPPTVVARPERLPRAVRRHAPAARSVSLGFAHDEVRRDRQAARAHDRARHRSGAAGLDRRRHVEPQPHRPPRRRDALAAARRQPRADAGHPRGQSVLRRRSAAHRPGVAARAQPWRDVGRRRLPDHRVAVAHERPRHATSWAATIISATSSRAGRLDALFHSGDTVPYDGMADELLRLAGGARSTSPCCRSMAACPSAGSRATSGVTRRPRSPTPSAPTSSCRCTTRCSPSTPRRPSFSSPPPNSSASPTACCAAVRCWTFHCVPRTRRPLLAAPRLAPRRSHHLERTIHDDHH